MLHLCVCVRARGCATGATPAAAMTRQSAASAPRRSCVCEGREIVWGGREEKNREERGGVCGVEGRRGEKQAGRQAGSGGPLPPATPSGKKPPSPSAGSLLPCSPSLLTPACSRSPPHARAHAQPPWRDEARATGGREPAGAHMLPNRQPRPAATPSSSSSSSSSFGGGGGGGGGGPAVEREQEALGGVPGLYNALSGRSVASL